MFERLKFARYAVRFEHAFRTDDWAPVAACLHPDATYAISGATVHHGKRRELGTVAHGRDAVVALFREMLDRIDRKYDRRIPRLAGVPRVVDGELVVPWRARYVLGKDSTVLTGVSRCRFEGSSIRTLSDAMPKAEVDAWVALPYRGGTPPTLDDMLAAAAQKI